MDRHGVHQVSWGSGEHRKMEDTGCEVICGDPRTPAVKGKVKVKVMAISTIFYTINSPPNSELQHSVL